MVEVNQDLERQPELVNREPYRSGWLLRMEIAEAGERVGLLDAAAYAAHVRNG